MSKYSSELKSYLYKKKIMESKNRELEPPKMNQVYTKNDIKNWISFGIKNGYVNKVKRDQVVKWVELILKHGVVKLSNELLLGENR